jgi:glycosyltransferase involved in cell wall biosynthesis
VKTDDRVVVLEQTNRGVSAARNKGIETASGVYVTFLDSDDYLEPAAIETMVKLLDESKADIVRTSWREIKDDKIKVGTEPVRTGSYSKSEISELSYKVVTYGLNSFSPLLMIQKDVLLSNHVRFPEGFSMMEDTCFYVDVLKVVKSIYISNEITYNYVLHSESATRSVNGFGDKINSIVKVNDYLAKKDFSTAQMRNVNATHVSIVANMLMARVKSVLDIKRVLSMLTLVNKNESVHNLYKHSNIASLDLYHKVEAWAVMTNNVFMVLALKLVRSLIRR